MKLGVRVALVIAICFAAVVSTACMMTKTSATKAPATIAPPAPQNPTPVAADTRFPMDLSQYRKRTCFYRGLSQFWMKPW